jgi:hypothetical protein
MYLQIPQEILLPIIEMLPGGAISTRGANEGYFFTKNNIRPKITIGISARKM